MPVMTMERVAAPRNQSRRSRPEPVLREHAPRRRASTASRLDWIVKKLKKLEATSRSRSANVASSVTTAEKPRRANATLATRSHAGRRIGPR